MTLWPGAINASAKDAYPSQNQDQNQTRLDPRQIHPGALKHPMINLHAIRLLLGPLLVADFARVERHVDERAWTLAFGEGPGVDDEYAFDDLERRWGV